MQANQSILHIELKARMFRKILVPTDGSALSEKAISAAVDIASACGAKIIGMTVAHPYLSSPLELTDTASASISHAEKALAAARQNVRKVEESAKAAGVECEIVIAQSFSPSAEIIDAAKRLRCDAIFMGSHWRKGLSRLLLGSETQQVLSRSDKPVMVFR
jgi:nucleotide-binding universal stress UspA family protein